MGNLSTFKFNILAKNGIRKKLILNHYQYKHYFRSQFIIISNINNTHICLSLLFKFSKKSNQSTYKTDHVILSIKVLWNKNSQCPNL